MLCVKRNYAKLKADQTYQRRVTMVDYAPMTLVRLDRCKAVFFVEYIGQFPGRQPHGKATTSSTPYIRTSKETMTKIRNSKHAPPMTVYQKLVLEDNTDIRDIPRNRAQVKNLMHREKKQDGCPLTDGNLAEQILKLTTMAQTGKGKFIRDLNLKFTGASVSPSVILYTEDQLEDLKSFCTTGRIWMGIDKTYNLGELLLTAIVYKNLAVYRKGTADHPVFVGPILLHGTSTVDDTKFQDMVIGSDDEKALTQAIQQAFPSCQAALCTRHLITNTTRHLRDKVGAASKERGHLVDKVFGPHGLIKSDDEMTFELKKDQLEPEWPATDAKYFKKLTTQLRDHVLKLHWNGSLEAGWTNNAAESANHVLKHMVEWKAQPLPSLVSMLHDKVQGQHAEVKRAFMNMGDFVIVPGHAQLVKFKSAEQWLEMSELQKAKLMRKVRKPAVSGTVLAKSGCLQVNSTPSKGKKPCQRKSSRSERAPKAKRMKGMNAEVLE